MIITRTPLRCSFAGGGTDIPWFYEKFGGAVISTAIDKYIYITARRMFDENSILLKYSKLEKVSQNSQLRHPIVREVLKKYGINSVDISVSSDVPAGTGLGSSSAFTVGLLNTVNVLLEQDLRKEDLAELACEIEIEKLSEPIGKQDQYASALGGLNLLEFSQNGQVGTKSLNLEQNRNFSNWFKEVAHLVQIGQTRSASKVLLEQKNQASRNPKAINSLLELRDLAYFAFENVESKPEIMADVLNKSWELKKSTSSEISNKVVDDLIMQGRANGALGGKLLGAGAGGFVLFLVEPSKRTQFLNEFSNHKVVRISIDNFGSKLLYKE